MTKVSVLMSVYNGARYLRQAVDSVLSQTFSDLEMLIVDDASTDETSLVLDNYADPRIVRLRNETNIGLTSSLNKGLEVARGEYVARQDADDVSLPERLAHQVSFLDANPRIALVGTAYVEDYEDGREDRVVRMPQAHEEMCEQLFYAHSFCHASVMMRRACLTAVGGYDEQFSVAQDIDLGLRLAQQFELANLPEPLYRVRRSSTSITGRKRDHQRKAARRAVVQALERSGPLHPTPLALGRFYWRWALDELADTRPEAALHCLHNGLSANQHLDEDWAYLVQAAVNRAFEAGPAGPAHLKASVDVVAGLSLLSSLFDLLPAALPRIRARRRCALGELYAAYAFAAFGSRDYRSALVHCLRAWRCHRSQWINRGLASVFLRSLAPATVRGKASV